MVLYANAKRSVAQIWCCSQNRKKRGPIFLLLSLVSSSAALPPTTMPPPPPVDAVSSVFRECHVWEDALQQQLDIVRRCILPLSASNHKGSMGRIGVLGGSDLYTGAPYFAALAALRTGADLAAVFTAATAAGPIRSYSPELMVQTVYNDNDDSLWKDDMELEGMEMEDRMVAAVVATFDRLHCLVIGPGLGRRPFVQRAVARIVRHARERQLHLVLDADALALVSSSSSNNPDHYHLLQGYSRAVITPNAVEYQRLVSAAAARNNTTNNHTVHDDDSDNDTIDPSVLQSVTVVRKGATDEIQIDGRTLFSCREPGGLKRAGGIGDVLAGAIGTLIAWQVVMVLKQNNNNTETYNNNNTDRAVVDLPLACWTACCLVKRATKRAFGIHRRAMGATHVLEQLGPTLQEMVGPEEDL